MALGKSHHLSGPQSPHLHNEEVGQMVSDGVPSYGGSLSGLMEEIRLSCVLRLHYHPKADPGAEWGSDTGPRVPIVVVHFPPHDNSGHTNQAP